MKAGDYARIALGCVRLANGTVALVAPGAFARGLGLDPPNDRAAAYSLRLFGVRTVLIGAQLLGPDDGARGRAVRVAPFVHAADTIAAAIAGVTGQLPARGAAKAVLVSSANTLLAALARAER
ncbi:MAG: hypothetical protein AABM30_11530 [Actinomycetota bacterium]